MSKLRLGASRESTCRIYPQIRYETLHVNIHDVPHQSAGSHNARSDSGLHNETSLERSTFKIVRIHGQPPSPSSAFEKCSGIVTNLDRDELMKHERIYFVGIEVNLDNATQEKNELVPHSHVAYRYEIEELIGSGGYGEVYRAFDHKEQRLVALKLIDPVRRVSSSSQAKNETKVLRKLNELDRDNSSNIIKFYETFDFRNQVCLTLELLDISLSEYIKRTQGSDLQTVKMFACSILRGLSFLHRHQIAHGDLKPRNILLIKRDGQDVKLIDFGMSFHADGRTKHKNFGTVYYNAPEINHIAGLICDLPVDMWSFGCIVAELFTGKRLFDGEDNFDQFAAFVEVLGPPPKTLFSRPNEYSHFMDDDWKPRYLSERPDRRAGDRVARPIRGPPRSKPLSSILQDSGSQQFIDFVRICLKWQPYLRLSVRNALDSDWVTGRTVDETDNEEETK